MASKPMLVIEMYRHFCECILCGKETVGEFAVPIYEDVIVPDDYDGEWGGAPVCPLCYYITRGIQSEYPGKGVTFGQVQKLIKNRKTCAFGAI